MQYEPVENVLMNLVLHELLNIMENKANVTRERYFKTTSGFKKTVVEKLYYLGNVFAV